jgi:RimJ/RimL family protein N-acetyltransferase
MGDMDGVEITAGRLHLRPWQPQDAPAVYAACQDPQIQRWIAAIPAPYREADAREFVDRLAPEGWAAGTEAAFAVLDATSGGCSRRWPCTTSTARTRSPRSATGAPPLLAAKA